MSISVPKRQTRESLAGKTIDIHSHAGVSIKAYAALEYPCAATVEGIYYRQLANDVDVNVVFPFGADLYFDPAGMAEGRCVPAAEPLSPAPYVKENEYLLREVYDYCSEHAHRFLPFVCVDPNREVATQLAAIESLAECYPIYGIKINPVLCQSPITGLLGSGQVFVDLARERDWPFLLHTTAQKDEEYSNLALSFEVVERYPELRWCLAHCLGFDAAGLARAAELPQVWVDTSALTIQVLATHQGNPAMAPPAERIVADFSDHCQVMQVLARDLPDTLLWGSDIPAYAYICRRMQGDGQFVDFRLKARYEDEVAALRALDAEAQQRVANRNSLDFLFGRQTP